jgi:hypothetical protein
MNPRLIRVELTRLRWRRAVLVLLLLAIVLPALIGVSRVWSTRPVTEAEIASAVEMGKTEIADCIAHPRRYQVPRATAEQGCTDRIVGWYTGHEKLGLAGERQGGSGMGVVAVLTAVLLLAATTFVGHDWASGSMSNQLLFESRRGRIWTAKAAAITLVALLTATVVSTAYWLGLWATMRMRDLYIADTALADSLAFGLRGAAFAAAAALGGYALTMLFRSTVATIGVLFVVSVAGATLVAVLGLSDQWQPHKNVAAIVKDGTTYYVNVPDSCYLSPSANQRPPENSECDPERDLSLWAGAGYYGAALVVVVGASMVSFRRRDVP